MRSILGAAAVLFAAAVSAVSTAGNRLLVVLDDVAEKENYKQFFGDLTGKNAADAMRILGTLGNIGPVLTGLQREAITLPMRRRRANMSSCSIWARGHTTTWCFCLQRSRVRFFGV